MKSTIISFSNGFSWLSYEVHEVNVETTTLPFSDDAKKLRACMKIFHERLVRSKPGIKAPVKQVGVRPVFLIKVSHVLLLKTAELCRLF